MRFEKKISAIATAAVQFRNGGQYPFRVLDQEGRKTTALCPMVDRIKKSEHLELKKDYQARVSPALSGGDTANYRGEHRNDV